MKRVVMEREFELQVTDPGKGDKRILTWPGVTGEDAAYRYADAHRGAVVYAWREKQTDVSPVDLRCIRIAEPGDKA